MNMFVVIWLGKNCYFLKSSQKDSIDYLYVDKDVVGKHFAWI